MGGFTITTLSWSGFCGINSSYFIFIFWDIESTKFIRKYLGQVQTKITDSTCGLGQEYMWEQEEAGFKSLYFTDMIE